MAEYQFSLLVTALVIITVSVPVVSGQQNSGEWFISESEPRLIQR